MKKAYIAILLAAYASLAASAADGWCHRVGGGLEYSTYFGTGVSDNTFEPGWGGFVETGWGDLTGVQFVFGISLDPLTNKAGRSTIKTMMIPVYYDIRFYFQCFDIPSANLYAHGFFSLGWYAGFNYYENVSTFDFFDAVLGGVGLQLAIPAEDFYIGVAAKPAYLIGNDLGQWLGLQLQASVGALNAD
jgi:hypothetical protein